MGRVIRAQRRGPPVVRAVVYDALQEAAAIRARAQRDGYEAGLALAARELLEIARVRGQALEAARRDALDLAVSLSKAIVGDAASRSSEAVATLLPSLLAKLRTARGIVVKAAPLDVPALQDVLAAVLEQQLVEGSVRVAPDTSIEPGGCLVESELGEVDARVHVRLSALAHALRSGTA